MHGFSDIYVRKAVTLFRNPFLAHKLRENGQPGIAVRVVPDFSILTILWPDKTLVERPLVDRPFGRWAHDGPDESEQRSTSVCTKWILTHGEEETETRKRDNDQAIDILLAGCRVAAAQHGLPLSVKLALLPTGLRWSGRRLCGG